MLGINKTMNYEDNFRTRIHLYNNSYYNND